jgi:ankyrin repeat protein
MFESKRPLPPNPSLEQQRTLARDLFHAWRAGDPAAIDRVRRHLPDKSRITLTDAQFVLAREYGFRSWPELRSHIADASARTVAGPHPVEAFKRAIERRDTANLRALLARDPTARRMIDEPLFSFNAPALVHVAGTGATEFVDVLLEFGADPNRCSEWWAGGFHPLHIARGKVAERLLAAGAVVDACAAANLDRADWLRSMLEENPERARERGGDGQTPLHFARSRSTIDLLLEYGAEIDARDIDHRATAAQWMIGRGPGSRTELARYLMDRGATADVFLCAALGLSDRLRELLDGDPSLVRERTGRGEYGVHPPSSDHIYTWTLGQYVTPQAVAAAFDQSGALAVIVERLTPNERFVAACARGDEVEAREMLRRFPAVIDELTEDDRRVLPDAAWAGDAAAVSLMLEVGFDPGARGQDGGTLLHCAAWKGHGECAEVALRHETVRRLIELRDPTYNGTALGWCVHGAINAHGPGANHAAVARMLLAAGADPETAGNEIPPALLDAFRMSRG